MELFNFDQADQLDNFIKNAARSSTLRSGAEFLQSWEWGEVLRREGENILRLGVRATAEDGGSGRSSVQGAGAGGTGQILAAATISQKFLGFSRSYWSAPRGPIINCEAGVTDEAGAAGREIINFLAGEIKKMDRSAIFWRIEPEKIEPEKLEPDATTGAAAGAAPKATVDNLPPGLPRVKTLDGQPAQTLILDLDWGEEKLLAQLSQKTRYNLRLAEKKGVQIKAGIAADLGEFWRLLSLTGERDKFRLHNLKHYQNLLGGGSGDFIKLFFATYEGRNIAAGLFAFYGDKVTYLHGASDNKFRSVMAPYLLQWSLIEMALGGAYKYYDFYGIDEKKWPGVTRFKLGFGGRRVFNAGTYDLIFRPTEYGIYNFVRSWRRLL